MNKIFLWIIGGTVAAIILNHLLDNRVIDIWMGFIRFSSHLVANSLAELTGNKQRYDIEVKQ